MRNKDEFSMTKLGLTASHSQQNLFDFDIIRSNKGNILIILSIKAEITHLNHYLN